jgi:5-dehydro-2-deoxygluconokinase
MRVFDLISMGRTIVDVYSNQVGCGLEETSSFSKYVGGCPANIAIGTARLGLRVAHVTRVGDDHHGRFLRDQLSREGVDVSHVWTDPAHLTGVAFLGIRDQDTFPLLHYRDNCADMAISAKDYSGEFIGSATALLVTGSHLTTAEAAANIDAAIACAKASGTRVIFDIDYRPLFWRLVAKDAGDSRYVRSERATAATQHVLSHADLIVGTEEEIRIAGGEMDTRKALVRIRRLSAAPIVMKRGPQGCVVFDAAIPEDLDNGILGRGFPVEVFNIVGAGDGFLSGFLSGWLRDASWQECCRRGNACGALVVSRHGCSPASPTDKELAWYLENAANEMALYDNRALESVHRATTRRARRQPVVVIDCEAPDIGAHLAVLGQQWLSRFGSIAADVVLRKKDSRVATGVMVNGDVCRDALFAIGSVTDWVVRAIEISGRKPLSFLGGKPAGVLLRSWPQNQIVKCSVPSVVEASSELQNERLRELQYAVEMWGHELMLVPELGTEPTELQLINRIHEIQALGIRPDWWGIQAAAEASAWASLQTAIETSNPMCRGILMLDSGGREIVSTYSDASRVCPLLLGIVAGPSIYAEPLLDWAAGRSDDSTLAWKIEAAIDKLIANWPGRG